MLRIEFKPDYAIIKVTDRRGQVLIPATKVVSVGLSELKIIHDLRKLKSTCVSSLKRATTLQFLKDLRGTREFIMQRGFAECKDCYKEAPPEEEPEEGSEAPHLQPLEIDNSRKMIPDLNEPFAKYLADSNKKIVHELAKEQPQCQLDLIKYEDKIFLLSFDAAYALFKDDYKECDYCM